MSQVGMHPLCIDTHSAAGTMLGTLNPRAPWEVRDIVPVVQMRKLKLRGHSRVPPNIQVSP